MIKVTLAIITDNDNRVFLQHRDGNAPTNPNKWGLWGGRIEGNETPEEALVRELKEEITIDIKSSQLIPFKVFTMQNFGDDWEGHVFNLCDVGIFDYRLQEGDDMRYFSLEELKNLDTDPIAAKILFDWSSNF